MQNGSYISHTEACGIQVGCVLLKYLADVKATRPIGHWSRTVTEQERNLYITHHKCMTVVKSLLSLRSYLEVARFMSHSEYHALHWILKLDDVTGKLTRWRFRLMEFYLEILHKAVIKHQCTDVLSRLLTNFSNHELREDDLPAIAVT